MRRDLRSLSLMVALALAGCGKSDDATKAAPAGEVLPGSVSDAMLPLDTVKSQPPLAPTATEASGTVEKRKGEAARDEAPSDAASATASEAAPADQASDSAEPAPE